MSIAALLSSRRASIGALAFACGVNACLLLADTSGLSGGDRPPAPEASVDSPAVVDSSIAIADATFDAADARVRPSPIARYRFLDDGGDTVHDDIAPPLDLSLQAVPIGDASPLVSWRWTASGLSIDGPSVATSSGPATKIAQAIEATGELTVEAWVEAANTSQGGPARIVSLSKDTDPPTAFTVGQQGGEWVFRTTVNGNFHAIMAFASTQRSQVVAVRHASGECKLFVDGIYAAGSVTPGPFEPAAPDAPLVMANENTHDRTWLGTLVSVTIFANALTAEEVAARFAAGAK